MRLRILAPAFVLVLMALSLGHVQIVRGANDSPERTTASGSGPTRITIPSINLAAEVEPVGYQLAGKTIAWQTAENAVGWHRSSAMPGSPGNTVMSGHNATRGSGVFRNLRKVRKGDTITVTVNGRKVDYVVTDRIIFRHLFVSEKRRAENATWLGSFGDERLTLITCYPWYSNTHRLVIVAHPIEPAYPIDMIRYRR